MLENAATLQKCPNFGRHFTTISPMFRRSEMKQYTSKNVCSRIKLETLKGEKVTDKNILSHFSGSN